MSKEKVVCVYHSRDLDGLASGAVVKHRYPEAVLLGYDYGIDTEFIYSAIDKDTTLFVVDVSFPKDVMLDLISKVFHFVWIDHHISAMKDMEGYSIAGIQSTKDSACKLAWKYFYGEDTTPPVIDLLSIYDSWKRASVGEQVWNEVVMPVQYRMRGLVSHPVQLFPYLTYKEEDLEEIIDAGKAILNYVKIQNKKDVEGAFERLIDGHRAICMNTVNFNSMAFEDIWDSRKYDIMVPFRFNGDKWAFSFYTDKPDVDCSKIAKKFGGGGHMKAAGCTVKTMEEVFKLSRVVVVEVEKPMHYFGLPVWAFQYVMYDGFMFYSSNDIDFEDRHIIPFQFEPKMFDTHIQKYIDDVNQNKLDKVILKINYIN